MEARIDLGEFRLDGEVEEERKQWEKDGTWEYACFAAGGEDEWEDSFDEDGKINTKSDAWLNWGEVAHREGLMDEAQESLYNEGRMVEVEDM